MDVVDNLGSEQFAHCSPVGKPGVIPSDASSDGPRVRHGRITVRAQKGQLSHGEHIVVRPIAGATVFFDPQTEINVNYLGNGDA